MTHFRMRLPAGKTISVGGAPLAPDAEHCVLVPVEHLAEVRRHGLIPAPSALAAPALPPASAEPAVSEDAPLPRRKATKS